MSSAVIINPSIKDKFMKKLTTAIAVAALTVSAPALADTTTVATPTTTEVSTQDLAFAFDDAENLQAVAMTNNEMQDTQGAVGPWGAAIGGAIGGISAISNGKNAQQIAAATAVGAASGFYGGWAGQVGGRIGGAIFGSTSVGLGVISGKF